MADPLSITASIVALLTTVVHIRKRLSDIKTSLRDAPTVVSDMIHEVAALHTGLKNWKDTADSMSHTNTPFPEIAEIAPVVADIERLLQRLTTKINTLFVAASNGTSSSAACIEVSTWKSKLNWLKEKDELSRLRDDLQKSRSILSFVFLSISMKLTLETRQVSMETAQLSAVEINKIHTIATEILVRINASSSSQMRDPGDPNEPDVNAVSRVYASSTAQTFGPPRPPVQLIQNTGSSHNTLQSTVSEQFTPPMFIPTYLDPLIKAPTKCHSSCRCRCHLRSGIGRFETPQLLGRIFGSSEIKYQGLPFLSPSCNRRSCRARKSFGVKMEVRFPPWLWKASLNFYVANNTYFGPEMGLRFRGDFGYNVDATSACTRGDINTLKKLFVEGKASPHLKMSGSNRNPLLHFAIAGAKWEICRFLLGFNLEQSAIEYSYAYFWGMIRCESRDAHVSRYNHPEFREGFESILPWSDEQFDGMADLSAIHRYVLGIGHTPYNSLTDLLEESAPGAIDDKDILGRTALYFAIIKEDFEAAETLLDFDADPNIWAHDISVISRFLNAFHRLLCFRLNDNPERMAMVARLLNSKADARITAPKSSRNALHIAARMNSDCPEVIEMLLEAGANPNAKDWFQQTPLNILMGSKFEKVECWKSYVRSFKLMVDYGGDLIYVSPCQSPPLLWAVDLCTTNPEYVEILETILEQPDINYLVKNPLEKTILHYAAFKYYPVDLKVMELLTEKCRDWEGLDIYAKDIFGYTAMDLAWGKDGSKYRGDEWDAALERLFQAVDPEYVFQRAITELTDSEDSDGDEEFVDALE